MPGGIGNPSRQLGKGHSLPEETEEDCPQALRHSENPGPTERPWVNPTKGWRLDSQEPPLRDGHRLGRGPRQL